MVKIHMTTDRQTERDGIYLLFYILYRVWLIIVW